MRKDSLIPSLLGIPPIQISRELLLAAFITRARTRSEMMAIADVGLDDPPAAVELAVRRCAHADAANSFGSRVRL